MTIITERGGVLTPDPTGARMKVRVITAGMGSSGMYPAEAIESAAPHIKRGVPVFADHPTVSEGYERPERSVRDLVGFFETPGEYVTESGEYAVDSEITVLPQWRETVAAMSEHIGLSIRATADVDESEGKRVIRRITSIESVDLVTKAGRGGRVLELLESARPDTAAQVTVSAPVVEAVSSDVRDWLRKAVQAAHGGADRYIYVRDHDDAYVYFDNESHGMSRDVTYRQAYTQGDGDVTLTGAPEEVNRETVYKPTTGTPTTPQEAPMAQEAKNPFAKGGAAAGGTEDPKDKRIKELEGQVADLKAQLKAKGSAKESATPTEETDVIESRADITEANNQVRKANEHLAEHIVAEAFQGITAPKATARLVKDAVEEAGTDALDVEQLRESATAEAAEFLAAAGQGRPNGLGGDTLTESHELTESDVDRSIAAAFGRQIKES